MGRSRQVKRERRADPAAAPTRTEPEAPDPLEPFALPVTCVTGLVFLALYVSTLYPSVPGGDSGELIVAAKSLGVAHPPGYPLFTLLGKLFTLLPLGTIAWRVNLMTAVCAAAAGALLARATWKAAGSCAAGLVAGALFALSPLVWRYAIQAEVFALNNVFVAALLLILARFDVDGWRGAPVCWAFTFGLGLTNHHTLLFVGLPIGLWILWRERTRLDARSVARLAVLGLLGLTPYLYLLVSPADGPWNTWGDTGTLRGFFAHLLREQYGTLQLGTMAAGGSLGARLFAWLSTLPHELLMVGPLLALVGIVSAWREGSARARVVVVASATLVFYLVVFGAMTKIALDDPFWHEVYSRFWQQANAIVCLLAGVGLGALVPWQARRGLAFLTVPVLVVAVLVARTHARENHREDRIVAEFGKAVLEGLPQHALLVTKGDLVWNALRYLQVCEGLRPDVRLLDVELLKAPWMTARLKRHAPDLTIPGDAYRAVPKLSSGNYDLAALFAANVSHFPVFSNALEHGDTSWQKSFAAWPEGVVDRIVPVDAAFDLDPWVAGRERPVPAIAVPEDAPPGSWESMVRDQLEDVDSRAGRRLLTEALTRKLGDAYVESAAKMLDRAAATRHEPSAPLQLNLGISYYLLRGKLPDAVPRMVKAWEVYLRIAPADAPERKLVQRALADPEHAQLGIGSR